MCGWVWGEFDHIGLHVTVWSGCGHVWLGVGWVWSGVTGYVTTECVLVMFQVPMTRLAARTTYSGSSHPRPSRLRTCPPRNGATPTWTRARALSSTPGLSASSCLVTVTSFTKNFNNICSIFYYFGTFLHFTEWKVCEYVFSWQADDILLVADAGPICPVTTLPLWNSFFLASALIIWFGMCPIKWYFNNLLG